MPHLIIISAAGTAQRRLLLDTRKRLSREGYEYGGKIGDASDWRDVFVPLDTPGLFARRRFVVLEEPGELRDIPKDLRPRLEGHDAATVIIALYADAPSKYLAKEVRDAAEILRPESPPKWGKARLRWIEEQGRSAGVRLQAGATALLSEWFDDPEEMRSELAKLALLAADRPVTEEDVRLACVDEGEGALLQLLDGVCRARRGEVLHALSRVERHEDILRVTGALYNRLRIALFMQLFPGGAGEAMQKVLKTRKYQHRLAGEACRHYRCAELQQVVVGLAGLSCGEKWGQGTGWKGLELLVLELVDRSRPSDGRPPGR
ncbi:MAG: hypothetical protein K9L28_09890 [Synergistales bacterium]|nr:hypothetical protein [Synergistales bacterium]